MRRRRPALPVLFALAVLGIHLEATAQDTASSPDAPASPVDATVPAISDAEYQLLQRKVIAGRATLAEVRKALTDPTVGTLTNTVHGLYSMRWHRGVYNLLHDMWASKSGSYPELQWAQFAKAPVRIALASTLLRVEPFEKDDYVEYLRAHRQDHHEFHRAQVLIGLGFNGSAQDIDYLREMAAGENPFVAQSAITALALMDRPQARDVLIELQTRFQGDPRERIITEVLGKAYHWPPEPDAAADPETGKL